EIVRTQAHFARTRNNDVEFLQQLAQAHIIGSGHAADVNAAFYAFPSKTKPIEMFIDAVAGIDDPLLISEQGISEIADSKYVEFLGIDLVRGIVANSCFLHLFCVIKNLREPRATTGRQGLLSITEGPQIGSAQQVACFRRHAGAVAILARVDFDSSERSSF